MKKISSLLLTFPFPIVSFLFFSVFHAPPQAMFWHVESFVRREKPTLRRHQKPVRVFFTYIGECVCIYLCVCSAQASAFAFWVTDSLLEFMYGHALSNYVSVLCSSHHQEPNSYTSSTVSCFLAALKNPSVFMCTSARKLNVHFETHRHVDINVVDSSNTECKECS